MEKYADKTCTADEIIAGANFAFSAIKKHQLFAEIASYYFFDFYKNNNMAAVRYAFLMLIPTGKIQWNKHILRIFIKAFTSV